MSPPLQISKLLGYYAFRQTLVKRTNDATLHRNHYHSIFEKQREDLGEDKHALVITDHFKGQITPHVSAILEDKLIHICLLPVNTMGLIQPMDLTVIKPVKDFVEGKFQDWY